MDIVTATDAASFFPPPGRWAVGVSGGADSIALLELLRHRSDLTLIVAHLDHETRGGGSAADAAFVRELAARWSVPCIVAQRAEVERHINALPVNRSARFRAARLQFFRDVIERERLEGILLAHHADDQAETLMQRLLRGSGPAGLTGMRADSVISGVRIVRPLLGVRRHALRELLRARGINWREDPSNEMPDQQRNRVRAILARHPALHDASTDLARASAALVRWLRDAGPRLAETFEARALHGVPPPLAREAARRWLAERAAERAAECAAERAAGPGQEITPHAAERLLQMATDAAAPARQHFPGGLLVRRRGGRIFVDAAH